MDWDHAPCTLDEELHEEPGGGEVGLAVGEDPGRNHEGGEEGGDDDGASAADEL